MNNYKVTCSVTFNIKAKSKGNAQRRAEILLEDRTIGIGSDWDEYRLVKIVEIPRQ